MEKRSAYYKACIGSDIKFAHETNDCSVRAFTVAADTTYAKAHAVHKMYGRKDRKGTLRSVSLKVAEFFGMERISMPIVTVQRFIRENPKGSYWVARSGHAFAIVDGVVYDWQYGTSPKSRIQCVYRKI